MAAERQTYHLKVDSSGRIVLPAEARARNHIAEGDTVVVVEDNNGLHVKHATRSWQNRLCGYDTHASKPDSLFFRLSMCR